MFTGGVDPKQPNRRSSQSIETNVGKWEDRKVTQIHEKDTPLPFDLRPLPRKSVGESKRPDSPLGAEALGESKTHFIPISSKKLPPAVATVAHVASGVFPEQAKGLKLLADITFLFQRYVTLTELKRPEVALASLKGKIAQAKKASSEHTKISMIFQKYFPDSTSTEDPSAENVKALNQEIVSMLNKHYPELNARIPKKDEFASCGVIVVSNNVKLPEDAPGILMHENKYKKIKKFLQTKIRTPVFSNISFKNYTKKLVAEILTWDGGLEILELCAKAHGGKLPLLKKGNFWAFLRKKNEIWVNQAQDFSKANYRTLEGQPFSGRMNNAITLIHELFHSMDPYLRQSDPNFVDPMMKKIWENKNELRAVLVANSFRPSLYLGQRSVYFLGMNINIPISPLMQQIGKELSQDPTRIITPEELNSITQHTKSYILKEQILKHVILPVDITALELGNAISAMSIEEQKTVKILYLKDSKFLKSLPANIGNLTNLKELNLMNCSGILNLPEGIGNLTNLQQLNLMNCKALLSLPANIGNLTNLQQLNLMNCKALLTLPENIGNLTNLQELNLMNCKALTSLPDGIGELKKLKILLLECSALGALPKSIGNLKALKILMLWGAKELEALPIEIGDLTALKELTLRDCNNLTALPESIGKLNKLITLDLQNCAKLPSDYQNSFLDFESTQAFLASLNSKK